MTLSGDYLEKAARSLDGASLLLASGYPDLAVSRAYYAAFYVATSLLLARGLEFRRHGAVIAQFGLYYARPGVLDARFHRLLRDGFRLRQEADYGAHWDYGDDTAATLIAEGREFLTAARAHLDPA